MPRIRSIKPDLPQSESMGRVSREARLCFILLWTVADDSGRLRGNSRMLASLLYPYDDDVPRLIDGWLDELDAEGCIRRYAVGGATYIEICKWLIHQKIDKPTPSKHPEFDPSSRILANPRESSPLDMDMDMEMEGDMDCLVAQRDTDHDPGPKPKRKAARRTRLPCDFTINEVGLKFAADRGVDAQAELPKFINFHTAKGSVMLDWQAAWRTWAGNARPTRPVANGSPHLSAHGAQTAQNASVARELLFGSQA
jgi:hypothetical protein